MRLLGCIAGCMVASIGLGQSGGLGTKPDLVSNSPTASAVGVWDVLQMIVALAIVFALLKWALPKIISKMNRRLGSSSSDTIRLEEQALFGGCQLQIVSVRGRTLLLGATQSGVTCLADLTKLASEPDHPAFFELVDSATHSETATDKEMIALERLSRLTV